MNDKELAFFLRKRADNKNVIFSNVGLPEPRGMEPTVTLYREQLLGFKDSMAELQAFAAQVCRVPLEELCLFDMYKFLLKRERAKRPKSKERR